MNIVLQGIAHTHFGPLLHLHKSDSTGGTDYIAILFFLD